MAKDRAVLSKKNPYWISKHRYYELKHFCLQYGEWQEAYQMLDEAPEIGRIIFSEEEAEWRDYTGNTATYKAHLKKQMDLVEWAGRVCDKEIGHYIFLSVTRDWSYNKLSMMEGMPCGRDMFYDRRRKFFYLLSRIR